MRRDRGRDQRDTWTNSSTYRRRAALVARYLRFFWHQVAPRREGWQREGQLQRRTRKGVGGEEYREYRRIIFAEASAEFFHSRSAAAQRQGRLRERRNR